MLEELINQQWQALAKLVRGGKRLGQLAFGTISAPKDSREKPSLTDSIGSRQRADALQEYRRRFATSTGRGFEPPATPVAPPVTPVPPPAYPASPPAAMMPPAPGQGFSEPPLPPLEPLRPSPERAALAEPPRRHYAHRRKSSKADWGSRLDRSLDEAWGALVSTLSWRRHELIAAIIACLLVFGGVYGYRTMKAGNTGSSAASISPIAQVPPLRTAEQRPPKPVRPAPGKKLFYDRLPAQDAQGADAPADPVPVQAASGGQAAESQGPAKSASASARPAAAPEQAHASQPPAPAAPAPPQPVLTAAVEPSSNAGHAPEARQPAKAVPAAIDAHPVEVPAAETVIATRQPPQPQPQHPAQTPPNDARPVQTASLEPASGGGQAPLRARPVEAAAPLLQVAPTIAAAHALAADRPTLVRSERYLPDGTRTDAGALTATAAAPASGAGEARAPVLAFVEPRPVPAPAPLSQAVEAPAAPSAPAPMAAEPAAPAPAAPLQQAAITPAPAEPVAAAPASALSGGYFAQIKSDQNRKGAEAELAAVAEKYKDVLGQVPLSTREADLKDKGIWFRVLAGPVKSHDDADNLCKRLKGAGVQACIVQKFD